MDTTMANRIDSTLSQVIGLIKPTPAQAANELAFARFLVDHISRNAPEGTETVLVGSMAKGTFLKDKRDIDIFVLFDAKTPRADLEPAICGIMGRAFPTLGYQLSYAEHPYVRFHIDGHRVDLVPAYKISAASERMSAVDRSVLHTVFVLDSMKQGQSDQVLLLKQFLRGCGIYGAEIKTEGFSGYLCELLVIRHGSFRKLLAAASKWGERVFMDLDSAYKKNEIKKAKERFGDFVVIDPTDSNRNVAAAVSKANFLLFKSEAKKFLKSPSQGFFFRIQENFDEQAKRAGKGRLVYVVSMPRPAVVDDVLWGQLKKLAGQLREHLFEFGPGDIIIDDSRHLVRLGIVLKRGNLPKMMLVAGPPLKMGKHSEDFRKAHPKSQFFKKGGKLWAETKRPVTDVTAALRGFFHVFSKTKSHLAYHEEMVIIEKMDMVARKNGGVRGKNPKNKGIIKKARRKAISMATKKKSVKKKAPVKKSKGKKK
jgi:tRNA nucleotidyltransferase (CCA-adding enzyme)